jgi:hypothetical protein
MIEWVRLGQDRIQWRAVIYTVMCTLFGFHIEKNIRDWLRETFSK